MIALFALLALGQSLDNGSKPVHGDGFCMAKVWLRLFPSEHATWLQGPDGVAVTIGDAEGSAWSAGSYENGIAVVPGYRDVGPIVGRKPGYTIRRMIAVEPDGRHPVYTLLPTRKLSRTEEIGFFDRDALEILSPRFKGDKRDDRFFDRVVTGPIAQARCAKFWKTMQ